MGVKELEDVKEQMNWHWRNSMRPVRFFAFDVRAVIPFFVLLFYARLHTLIICILTTMFFWILEKKGLTVVASMRAMRVFMIGTFRPGWAKYKYRRLVDYGR